MSSFVESLRKRLSSCSGAVRRKPWSWLAACVLAVMAERRAARRALIISTRPSPLLGTPDVSPANTARAARSASEGSDLTLGRLGCSTSSTSIPWPSSGEQALPHSCWYLLPQRTSRGRSPPPSTGASRKPSRSLARSTRPGVCLDDPQPPLRGSRGACPHPRSPRPRCPVFRRRSSSRPKLLSMSRLLSTRGAGETGRYCEESRHRRAPMRSRRSGPRWPLSDTKVSGRRVTCKAPLAHVEGGSGRPEALPTAILQDTHGVEGEFLEVHFHGSVLVLTHRAGYPTQAWVISSRT